MVTWLSVHSVSILVALCGAAIVALTVLHITIRTIRECVALFLHRESHGDHQCTESEKYKTTLRILLWQEGSHKMTSIFSYNNQYLLMNNQRHLEYDIICMEDVASTIDDAWRYVYHSYTWWCMENMSPSTLSFSLCNTDSHCNSSTLLWSFVTQTK